MNGHVKLECYITKNLERLASNKHSSLASLFVSYDENEVLWIRSQVYSSGAYPLDKGVNYGGKKFYKIKRWVS